MLADILRTLYSNNGDVYKILNESCHITEIEKETEIVLLFNTGFRFYTHKRTPIDLYFDLMKPKVIRVPASPMPLKPPHLIGFIGAIKESKYLERVCDYFCIHIDSDEVKLRDVKNATDDLEIVLRGLGLVYYEDLDDVLKVGADLSTIKILDSKGDVHSHTTFQIIQGEEIIELPLRRTFAQLVFFDGRRFSEYIQMSGDRTLTREEWLNEEFGEEADTAYWNID